MTGPDHHAEMEAHYAAGRERQDREADPIRMKFLLRSGNAFMVDGVLDWTIKTAPVTGRIVQVELVQSPDPKYARVIMETLDVGQIEGVLILPPFGPGRRANDADR